MKTLTILFFTAIICNAQSIKIQKNTNLIIQKNTNIQIFNQKNQIKKTTIFTDTTIIKNKPNPAKN